MAQDIRKMFQKEKDLPSEKMEKGHRNRFEAKLEKAVPQETSEERSSDKSFFFLKIAAVFIVAVGVAFFFLTSDNGINNHQVVETPVPEEEKEEVAPVKEYQLSDVSPEYKKVEDYYLASLNIELAKLDVNEENRALVDAFMEQLAELDKEYKRLNAEIERNGLNERSVEAMIGNLQLRLELLFKLKNKINEINESQNEKYENLQA